MPKATMSTSPLKSPSFLTRNAKSPHKGTRQNTKKKKNVVNPFRQQDEDEELEKISHNRRRWSHVFPLGELEFKRHTGPLWKSLCQPAILPLTIDYFPTPQELDDEEKYLFSPYLLTLQGLESTYYSSHSELLLEMVRQRITQDFQVVPPSAVSASNTVREGDIQHFLSMGHRIHVLTYDSQTDAIDVKLYTARIADDSPVTYYYYLYSSSRKSYGRTVQTFEKYARPYRWNLMDHLVLEDTDKSFTTGTRCRRLQFGLIPPKLADSEAEKLYIEKFKNFLDYLGKLREKDEVNSELGVQIITNEDKPVSDSAKVTRKIRKGTIEEMKSLIIKLQKRKKDMYEWVEVAIDPVFEVSRNYRIVLHWLIASTGKVENLLQQLQRRCTQFGLEMTTFPETSISRNLLINPFITPEFFCVRKPDHNKTIVTWLLDEDFVYDGIHMTNPSYLKTIENSHEFKFEVKRWCKEIHSVPARQYVYRTGAVFIRLIMDEQGWLILVVILNLRLNKKLRETAVDKLVSLRSFMKSVIQKSE